MKKIAQVALALKSSLKNIQQVIKRVRVASIRSQAF